MIAPDNIVRVIDAFVDAIDLDKLGFTHVKAHKRGAPPYHPGLLLKIYIYGYINRVRSSRRLELECGRNIELMWLTGCRKPSYHTISDFRSIKPHRKALKATFLVADFSVENTSDIHLLGKMPQRPRRNSALKPYLRRGVSILGVNGLLERVKTVFSAILALEHRMERMNRPSGFENFGMVWRAWMDQGRAHSIRA